MQVIFSRIDFFKLTWLLCMFMPCFLFNHTSWEFSFRDCDIWNSCLLGFIKSFPEFTVSVSWIIISWTRAVSILSSIVWLVVTVSSWDQISKSLLRFIIIVVVWDPIALIPNIRILFAKAMTIVVFIQGIIITVWTSFKIPSNFKTAYSSLT